MAWSWSALEAFETCPKRHFHTKVAKDVADPPGEAAEWGSRVHKVLDERIKSGTPIVGTMGAFEPYVSQLEAAPGKLYGEQQVALTQDLKPTTWFSKTVWVRAIVDAVVDAGSKILMIDWKTGKRKPSGQLRLSAAIGAAVYPQAERFDTAFIWFKDKRIDRQTVARPEVPGIWEEFLPRVERLEDAIRTGDFPEKPSGLCRKWCPVKQCRYHGG
jgi:hypothetical protein